jgi:tight adherence protein B
MMSSALVLIALTAAAGVLLFAQQARASQIRRLNVLVDTPQAALANGESRNQTSLLEYYMPRSLFRKFHLLGIEPTAGQLAIVASAFAFFVMLIATIAGTLSAIALAVGVLLFGAIALNFLANRKVNALGVLMPGFFDRVRQLLVIGNSLPTAFARAIHGAQPQLAAFFAPTIRRIGNGAGFAESIRQSADDIGIYEMHLFATAVSTNMRFGGSLTHALNNLIAYLRKRSAIDRELRASTSQIRFSAWVLAALPILVAGLIVSQNTEYAQWFIADPLGRWLLVYCIVSQILGILVMRAITKTEF